MRGRDDDSQLAAYVMQRGNNRQAVFFGDADRWAYLMQREPAKTYLPDPSGQRAISIGYAEAPVP